ncbi:HTH-type transcriptional repressor YtrA [Leuconostoc litchii]|uniref:GntR family transcriptional regulator n=1 Tax=Leuconostoc litchii TaxID=1981069 RepID=A0A6P2CMU8_9LACO|nr:GntR family transcriptional regulator [Leuconostoc litchii]TYC46224.1 GntR family transcriptional regulator [Leuconostoc litchii]GMA69928.1 HTH-type transcriptional repressor YtrA [Leuconostoc litchii]
MPQIKRSQPLYEQLMWRIKTQIASGVLEIGEKLPSVREMALIEGLNPNTVAKAYKALEAQNVIETVTGKGTFVRENEGIVDDKLLSQLHLQMTEVVIEAKRAAIDAEQLHKWIEELYGEIS